MLHTLRSKMLPHHVNELPRPVHDFPQASTLLVNPSGTCCMAAAGFLQSRVMPFTVERRAFPSTCLSLR